MNTRAISLGLFACTTWCSIAANAADCANKLGSNPTAQDFITCLNEIQGEANTKLAGQVSIPSGAVIAFANDCPRDGWQLTFGEAAGRVIVGAGFGEGLTPRKLGKMGGEEMHKLTIEEMPRHDHSNGDFNQLMKLSGGWTARVGDDGTNEPTLNVSRQLQMLGGDQPHNIMPPFIVLNLCKKD